MLPRQVIVLDGAQCPTFVGMIDWKSHRLYPYNLIGLGSVPCIGTVVNYSLYSVLFLSAPFEISTVIRHQFFRRFLDMWDKRQSVVLKTSSPLLPNEGFGDHTRPKL